MCTSRALLRVVLLLCLAPSAATAGPLQDDLAARRARLLDRLGPDAMAIFWSAPERTFSMDVQYEYRQDSNLLYLTGILYGKWPKARLVTVETSGFRVGAAMSAAATRGSADAIAAVRDVLEEWRRAPALD